jgi:hypothetical protein
MNARAMLDKIKLPDSLRDAILIGIFYFVWNFNSRLSSIETTQQLMLNGKIQIAQNK